MSIRNERFDAIIVDPDTATRMRLKQATTSVVQFNRVHQCGSIHEALSKVSGSENLDVCFLSSALSREESDKFIHTAKSSKNAQDAAFIRVLKGNAQQSTEIANNVIGGFDGMLFEPYSVDQLINITELSAKVRKERSGVREMAAFKLLAEDYINLLNRAAYIKSQGLDSSNLMRKLSEACATLRKMQPESLQNYLTVAVDAFIEAPVPTQIFEKKIYGGASKRVKKKSTDFLEEIAKAG